MPFVPLRLAPGADLRRSLEETARSSADRAGFVVAGIGSLTSAAVRFAGAETATLIPGPLEILGLAGTITPDGAHLHVTLADARGTVIGGHLGAGSIVRTTAELLIAPLPDWQLARVWDPATGYPELLVRRVAEGAPAAKPQGDTP